MIQQINSQFLRRFIKSLTALAGALVMVSLLLHIGAPLRSASGAAQVTGLQVKKIGPASAIAGSTITYTLLVTNATGLTLNGVVITDTWNSQEYSGTYASGGDVVVNSSTYLTQPVKYAQFNLAPLAPNAVGLITLTMWISPQLQPRLQPPVVGPTVLGNSVVITTSTPNVTGSTDRADTAIVGPLLQLTKSYTPTNPRIGRLLTYTFKLENKFRSDAIDATNVVITEHLPNYTIFYTASPASLATYYPLMNTVQWNLIQTIPVSSAVYLTLTVQISPTAPYVNISNPKAFCAVMADGLPLWMTCTSDVNTLNNDTFEKVGVTVSPPQQSGTISKTFPNRVMTYTVSVYNPFSTTTTGMIVTDTLPTYNNALTQTFIYSSLVSSSPPALPLVLSTGPLAVVWQLPAIGGWGVYSFTFRVTVPPQMRIDDNATQRLYQNKLSGNYAGVALTTNDGGHDDSMRVWVVPQILIFKTVTPTQQIFGQPVTYTLVVSNSGPTTIHDIQLTDILPTAVGSCAFQWDSFVSGQSPILAAGNLVSWSGITLTGYAQTTLATFRATVIGQTNANCGNTVQGYSPDTYIVKRTNLAPVVVKPPFLYNKTVNPASVVLSDSIQYTVYEYNIGGVDALMNSFTDILPTGFYYGGNPTYFDGTDMVLLANHGNEYQTAFTVDVISTTVSCDNLPNTVYQVPNKLVMNIASPPEVAGNWVNATNVAGVLVRPQAQVSKVANPVNALPGDVVTFTITLSNNTSSLIGSLRVTDTLPSGFTFGGVILGTPAPFAVVPPNVFWQPISIPANGKTTLVMRTVATTTIGSFQNIVKASSLTDPVICIPKFSLPISVKPGLIKISKTAAPGTVSPLGQFVYDINLQNIGPYTITLARFTDTLPGVPGYLWKYVSMQSGDPTPISTLPPAWANLTLPPNYNQHLRFTVRSNTQVGTYKNLTVTAALAGYMTATLPSKWALSTDPSYNGAPLTVIPGVGVAKDVEPDNATSNGTVTYTITIVNISGQTINNIRITDTLPTGFTFAGYVSGDLPILFTPQVIWSPGSMANGTTKVLVFRAHIANNQTSGTYYNRVTVTADNISIAPTGDVAPVIVQGIPSLVMSKSAAPSAVAVGHEVTYTLNLFNPDVSFTVTARLTDTLPAGFSFAGMLSGSAPVITSPQVIWTNFQVGPNASKQLIFKVLVAPTTADGTYYNQLDGSSSQTVFQSTGATAPVLVVASPKFDVQVSKTDNAYTNTLGGTRVYTIHYTNTLNTLNLIARNVVVTDTFDPVDYLIADAPGWTLAAPGIYTQSIGNLPAGATGWVTLALQVDPGIPSDYLIVTNTAQIRADAPLNVPEAIEQPASNNTAIDVDTIRGADIAVLGLTYTPASLHQNSLITVVVTLQNQGIDPVIGPDGMSWFSTDLYVKPLGDPPPSGPDDRYLGLCPVITDYCPSTARWSLHKDLNSGLAPGEVGTLTYHYVLPTVGTQWLYAQADPYWGLPATTTFGTPDHGRIFERNEINNIFGPVAINVNANVYLPIVLRNY